ncbi:hypothetical protein THASP1DRAFT_32113 [Thamnocephalis sphaerospora]|uniref:Uncharacterized protein n=1 Tax=Thamnocephalis sphaerospora TaxID=78915 RepID=A0A4P9XLA7_9FUNG|nr:hypothetical protein THASP1DRAFT_32113 [Thamnocephalis sphaerospora]|eukprot:RKP06060.1 hypothetical protein THASP1DRAFT_32113 [Thamnocephalis sphaerospora]
MVPPHGVNLTMTSLPVLVPHHSYTIIADIRSSPAVHQINDAMGNTVCVVKRGRLRRRRLRRAVTPSGDELCWSFYVPKERKGFARFLRNAGRKNKDRETLTEVPASRSPVPTVRGGRAPVPGSTIGTMSRMNSHESDVSSSPSETNTLSHTLPMSPRMQELMLGPSEVLVDVEDTDEKLIHFRWRATEYAWRWSRTTRRLDCLCTRASPEMVKASQSPDIRLRDLLDAPANLLVATISVPIAAEWLTASLVFPNGRCDDADLEQMLLLSATQLLERLNQFDASDGLSVRRRSWLPHRGKQRKPSFDST